MPDERHARVRWTLRVGTACLFLFSWIPLLGYRLDDAFITFRYARNLAEGMGPVFNPGQAVEGYTTFLWMLVSALPFTLLDDAAALLTLELLGGALGIFVLWRAASFPGPGGALRIRAGVILLAASPIFVVNCADGMETPLFMALLLETGRAFVRPASRSAGALTGGLVAACVLTRPESLPLLLLLPVLRAGLHREGAAAWTTGFLAAGLLPVLGHQAWRMAYYGALVPNTYFAKATGAVRPRIDAGLADFLAFLSGPAPLPPLWLWLAAGLAVAGLLAVWRTTTPAGRVWLAGLWTVVGFRTAFDVWSGSEAMGTFRFLAPALPALVVLADEGARQLLARGARGRATDPAFVIPFGIPAAVALLAVAALGAAETRQVIATRDAYRQGLENAHIALGRWLAETRPPETTVAIGDAGAVPFYSRMPVIDLWGLNDATIARLPGEYGKRAGVADYALARRPGIVVLWNLVSIHENSGRLRILGAWPFDREIAGHPVFREEYRFVREFTFRAAGERPGTGYYLDVFEHRPGAGRRGS